jgi:hypothetical protein
MYNRGRGTISRAFQGGRKVEIAANVPKQPQLLPFVSLYGALDEAEVVRKCTCITLIFVTWSLFYVFIFFLFCFFVYACIVYAYFCDYLCLLHA